MLLPGFWRHFEQRELLQHPFWKPFCKLLLSKVWINVKWEILVCTDICSSVERTVMAFDYCFWLNLAESELKWIIFFNTITINLKWICNGWELCNNMFPSQIIWCSENSKIFFWTIYRSLLTVANQVFMSRTS